VVTFAEKLCALSGLPSGTATVEEHLCAITAGSGSSVSDTLVGLIVDEVSIVGVIGAADSLVGTYDDGDTLIGLVGLADEVVGIAFDEAPILGLVDC